MGVALTNSLEGTYMMILFSLMLFGGDGAHAGKIFPHVKPVCAVDLATLIDVDFELQAKFVATQLLQFGKEAWRAALARDFSAEHDLKILTPLTYQAPHVPGMITKAEADYTIAEREQFRQAIQDPTKLPRAWRLRAARAFLVAVGGGSASSVTHLNLHVYARTREMLVDVPDRIIGNLIPDATPQEIKFLKR